MNKIGSTEYYEAYAKISLIDLYNNKLIKAKIIGKESPDIQDDINEIGIEVTRADSNQDCMATTISNRYFGKNLDFATIDKNVKKNFRNFHGILQHAGCINYISSSKGLVDIQTYRDNIKECIIKKSKKFKKNYKKFRENDLYIFIGFCLEYHDILAIIEDIDLNDIPFNYIFINCIDSLYIYSKNDGIVKKEIEKNKLAYYKKEALNYTE